MTKKDFWFKEETDGTTRIGLSREGADTIGDVAYFAFSVQDHLVENEDFFSVEGSKAVTDFLAPVSGEIVAKNSRLEDYPEELNSDDPDKNWLLVIDPNK
ncbi:glycine cleavage system protein H [Aerococcus kribbianus]|uniref:Glycine cleavage system protein H n=1 Tax=Aerococcus kribbianus TaxID=2999064 RepID=A0A9X3JEV0_9LACT|nr:MULTISPECIES: glycine cleavage system protein H [unclassified Aerococcus]MCZ0717003.1 glycine cleavage system protein H [Aerococcus sp. YH-aer221]MCZ0725291.1 glycine cleavage system protein H [Aerococcus sp. YH-aer222]